MYSKTCRTGVILVVAAVLIWGFSTANVRATTSTALPVEDASALAAATDVVYNQPPNPNGGIFKSSLIEPNGSSSDEWVWDDFRLDWPQAITEIQWRGGYKFGSHSPVIGFTLKIYPTNQTGYEPDVAHPPLESYQLSDNAGETAADVLGGVQTYDYHYILPVPFQAAAGTKYWVQIEASQQSAALAPDWGLSAGLGGDNHHFRKCCNEGLYQTITGDTAFTLLGPGVPIRDLTALNDSPTPLGSTTTFTATVGAGSNVSYTWSLGNGAVAQGQNVMFAYGTAGFYTAVVTAANAVSVVTATTPVTIYGPNPLANAGPDQTALEGALVALDGSGSLAVPGHAPLTYFWEQTGGASVVLSSAVISQPTFTAPAQPSLITFTLSVTDTLGLGSVPDLVQIQVVHRYPVYLPLVMKIQ